MSDTKFWPPTFNEQNLAGDIHIRPEDIADYSYQEGERQRYTQSGWNKAFKIGIARMDESPVMVDPALAWHDVGCVKRYGATGDSQCACEIRRAQRTGAEP